MSRISRADKFGGLKEVHFIVRGFLVGFPEVRLTVLNHDENDDGNFLALDVISPSLVSDSENKKGDLKNTVVKEDVDKSRQNIDQMMSLKADIAGLRIEKWDRYYSYDKDHYAIMDGLKWKLTLRFEKGRTIVREGDNAYPENWNDLIKALSHYTSVFNFLLEDEK